MAERQVHPISAVWEAKCGAAADIQTCEESGEKAEGTAEERGCESTRRPY